MRIAREQVPRPNACGCVRVCSEVTVPTWTLRRGARGRSAAPGPTETPQGEGEGGVQNRSAEDWHNGDPAQEGIQDRVRGLATETLRRGAQCRSAED